MKQHALIVGGTGMLSEVTLWLANHYERVTVIGRTEEKFNLLQDKASHPERLHFISCDYQDVDDFTKKVADVLDIEGPAELAVTWIHSNNKQALIQLERIISKINSDEWKLFHIHGSMASRQPHRTLTGSPNCKDHEIILGFILKGNDSSRWLTNYEISAGVMDAIKENSHTKVIGTVEPWDRRPK